MGKFFLLLHSVYIKAEFNKFSSKILPKMPANFRDWSLGSEVWEVWFPADIFAKQQAASKQQGRMQRQRDNSATKRNEREWPTIKEYKEFITCRLNISCLGAVMLPQQQ